MMKAPNYSNPSPPRLRVTRPPAVTAPPVTRRTSSVAPVRVEFYKPSEKHRLCAWEATRPKRIVVAGTVMAAGASIPHDLAQYVVEAATGFEHGFWGLVARGATFKSTQRRRTKPGRAVIAAHRDDLVQSEVLAGEHLQRWRNGEATPVTEALTAATRQWDELRIGDRLVFTWPGATGTIVRAEDRRAAG